VGGTVKNIVPETGLLASESNLERAVEQLITARLNPRAWALDHITCFRSWEKLNVVLREHAAGKRLSWTRDISARSASPESRYVRDADRNRRDEWNRRLGE